MSIISAIGGALSLGISAIVSEAKNKKNGSSNDPQKQQMEQEKQNNLNQQQDVTNQQKQEDQVLKAKKQELDDLLVEQGIQTNLLSKKQELLNNETEESMQVSLKKEIVEIQTLLDTLKVKIETVQKRIQESEKNISNYSAQLSGLAEGLKSLTDSLTKMEENAAKAADAHAKKAAALLEKKLEMQKQNRDALAQIEKFALLVQRNQNKVITADMAVQMLFIAIGCLKNIASALLQASSFWDSLSQYCRTLSSSQVGELIASSSSFSKEDRIAFFTDPDFIATIIRYASNWAAMYYVSDEYYQTSKEISQKVDGNFRKMPTQEEARAIAQSQSKAILEDVAKQKRDNEEATNLLTKQKEVLLA